MPIRAVSKKPCISNCDEKTRKVEKRCVKHTHDKYLVKKEKSTANEIPKGNSGRTTKIAKQLQFCSALMDMLHIKEGLCRAIHSFQEFLALLLMNLSWNQFRTYFSLALPLPLRCSLFFFVHSLLSLYVEWSRPFLRPIIMWSTVCSMRLQ